MANEFHSGGASSEAFTSMVPRLALDAKACEALKKSQSTHGSTLESSAARMIHALRDQKSTFRMNHVDAGWISSDEMDRIILHGILVSPSEWTEVFVNTLCQVCEWLISPESEEDSVPLAAFRKSYPKYFLNHLYFVALLKKEGFLPPEIESLMRRERLKDFAYSYPSVVFPALLQSLERSFFPPIWQIIKKIPVFVSREAHLLHFYSCFLDKLTPEDQKEICSILKGLVPEIKISKTRAILFYFALKKHSHKERKEFLHTLGLNFDEIIEDPRDLRRVFHLPLDDLSMEERKELLNVLRPGVGESIPPRSGAYFL